MRSTVPASLIAIAVCAIAVCAIATPADANGDETPAGRARPGVTARAFGFADAGTMPGIGLGAGAGIDVVVGSLSFDLAGRIWRSERRARSPGLGVDLDLHSGSGGVCRIRRWTVCAGIELGSMTVEPSGLGTERSAAARLWAAGLGVRRALELRRFVQVELSFELLGYLSHPSFAIESDAMRVRLHAVGPISVRAGLGLRLW